MDNANIQKKTATNTTTHKSFLSSFSVETNQNIDYRGSSTKPSTYVLLPSMINYLVEGSSHLVGWSPDYFERTQ